MSAAHSPGTDATVMMSAAAMEQTIHTLARQIAAGVPAVSDIVMLGILTRGVPLAERLARQIAEMTGQDAPPVGALSTTLYRDDLRSGQGSGIKSVGYTHFDFPLDGRTVILVDDVLAAGRTIRAAMDEVFDYGRPARIQLACMIDRGNRELPIAPNYCGWTVSTKETDWVAVRMQEIDGEDIVLLQANAHPAAESGDHE